MKKKVLETIVFSIFVVGIALATLFFCNWLGNIHQHKQAVKEWETRQLKQEIYMQGWHDGQKNLVLYSHVNNGQKITNLTMQATNAFKGMRY